jgi:hypothetical protein
MKLRMVLLARALAALWAGFWLFFAIVESWVFHTPANAAAPWVGVALVFAVLALVPWHWEVPGGLLLVAGGLLVAMAYAIWGPPGLPLSSRVTTIAVLGLPPLAAGILFLVHHRAETVGRSVS